MDSPLIFGGQYFREAFSDTESLIANAKHLLLDVDFDTMIGTGLSGSLVIPILARALDKHWAIVRKDSDGSHSSSKIEGRVGNRYVFVDDFVSTGATRARVIKTVDKVISAYNEGRDNKVTVDYVGTYSYSWMEFIPDRRQ